VQGQNAKTQRKTHPSDLLCSAELLSREHVASSFKKQELLVSAKMWLKKFRAQPLEVHKQAMSGD
jgi:hypothetical protein